MRRRPVPVLVGGVLLALAACAPGEPGAVPTTTPPVAIGGGGAGATVDAAPVDPEAALPPSCRTIELEEGARIASADLATCLTDYLRQAGSGYWEGEQPGMTATQRWALADGGLYAVGTRNGEPSVVLTPDTGWLHSDDGWVRGDAGGSPEEQQAADGIDMYRRSSLPEMTYAMVSQAPGFTVGAQEEVEVAEGRTAVLWPIRSDGPFAPFPGVAELVVDELVVWTELPGPTHRLDATSGGPAGTATSITRYSRWGEQVDLAEVEELLGAPVPTGGRSGDG